MRRFFPPALASLLVLVGSEGVSFAENEPCRANQRTTADPRPEPSGPDLDAFDDSLMNAVLRDGT